MHDHEFNPESGWCEVCGTARIDGRLMTRAGTEFRPPQGPDWRTPTPTLFDPEPA